MHGSNSDTGDEKNLTKPFEKTPLNYLGQQPYFLNKCLKTIRLPSAPLCNHKRLGSTAPVSDELEHLFGREATGKGSVSLKQSLQALVTQTGETLWTQLIYDPPLCISIEKPTLEAENRML